MQEKTGTQNLSTRIFRGIDKMLRICGTSELEQKIAGKRFIAIGAGKMLSRIVKETAWHFEYAVDSDPAKNGMILDEIGVSVHDWTYLSADHSTDQVYLITAVHFEELYERLLQSPQFKDNDIYIYSLLVRAEYDVRRDSYQRKEIVYPEKRAGGIPKKIHYTWFSGDEMPDAFKRCVDSWHKYCPDYEFIKWDMDNYDYQKNCFCREAIENRKWAFASDFARADIVYHHGGIYLDADVEVVRNLDALLDQEAFIGFESTEWVDPGSGFGAAAGNPVVGRFLALYDDKRFVLEDGSFNMLPCPKYYTKALTECGLKLDGSYQLLDHIAVYPYDYFCPHSFWTDRLFQREYTYSIHHHVASWKNEEEREFNLRQTDLIKSVLGS